MAFERVLIATGDETVRFHLNGLLDDLPNDIVIQQLHRCESYAELVLAAHSECDFELVIIDQSLRLNPESTGGSISDSAINLVKALSRNVPPAILFLSHELCEAEVEELFQHDHCKWLSFLSSNFGDRVQKLVIQLTQLDNTNAIKNGKINSTIAETLEPVTRETDSAITIEFDISNPDRQSCNIYYHDVFGAAPQNPSIDLAADGKRLKRFVQDCEEFEVTHLGNPDLWSNRLRRLGEDASEIIFQNHEAQQELTTAFELCKQRPESLKIRFSISPDQHPGFYEAAIAEQNDDHLMVKATTARRVNIGTTSPPVLKWCERDRLSILAIESLVGPNDVIKGADDIGLSDLHGPADECMIFDRLRESVAQNKLWSPDGTYPGSVVKVAIGNVTVLRGTDDVQMSLKQRIRGELMDQNKQYDIVHYAGHSICHDGKNPFETSRLIVPTTEQGVAEMINMRELANWLSRSSVQFVYLSSCKSAIGGCASRAAVAEALAREAIPACLGFRWEIDDGSATQIAKMFYHSLFCETQSLDEALMKVRQEVYLRDPNANPIWAAPVLFLQSQHWNTGQNRASRIPARPSFVGGC